MPEEPNPELLLIDEIASQIEDDERVIEGLGTGILSLGDLERWRQSRWEAEKRFLHETGRLIEEMRRQGFGHMMSSSRPGPDLRRPQRAGTLPALRPRRRRRPFESRAPEPTARRGPRQRRFTLELAELGLPCSLRLSGGYDEVLDAGAWHARRSHRVEGGMESLRDSLAHAIVEDMNGPDRRFGRGSEQELVSDEAANQTRSGASSWDTHV